MIEDKKLACLGVVEGAKPLAKSEAFQLSLFELWRTQWRKGPEIQIKCLFLNALPEPDFKYSSKAYALALFSKAKYITNFQGLYFSV